MPSIRALMLCLTVLAFMSSAAKANDGPHLANATRNSWADQTSIVIWTRTTENPEFKANGVDFRDLSPKQARQLEQTRDAETILYGQLIPLTKLHQTLGACPGAAGQVRLTYFPENEPDQKMSTNWVATHPDSDFTAQWKLENLQPNTHYSTIIEARGLDGRDVTAKTEGAFRTAPAADQAEPITFCFTTCHDFIRRDDGMKGHKIYPAMTNIAPDFVVHAGDIEYYDKPRPWAMSLELMRFKWGRIFALPNNRQFYHTTSSYFLKDDHDTLKNDCWAGQRYGTVTFEQGVKIFNEEQFPTHTPRYKTVNWGQDLQVWFLEGRDYRSPNTMPDGPEKTILGETQKAWLFKTLEASTATFKIICSPTPIVGPDRKNKHDNHANDVFEYEGNQIREKLSGIDNVIVLCGDRHWQYASVDEKTNLWEFGCGPGSEKHQFGWKKGDERPTHRFLRVAGGFLSGDLKYNKDGSPQLTMQHRDVNGKPVSKFVFPTTGE